MSKFRPIYLDYNATSPVDPRVVEEMLPYFTERFGNPASGGHSWGWDADAAMEKARQQVANFLGALPLEVFFTSGATESNNWAIKGLVEAWKQENSSAVPEIISSVIEHPSVIKALEWAQDQGCKIHWAPVQKDGTVKVTDVKSLCNSNTRLISLMWVHNELGSVNPVPDLAQFAHENQILFHSDATQAVGKIPLRFDQSCVDLLSFSAHKFFGPKGIGALLIRQRSPKVKLHSLLLGGGHERGQRSGTPNIPYIVALGKICQILEAESAQHQMVYRERIGNFWKGLQARIEGLELNGPPLGERAPNNLNITFTRHQVPSSVPGIGVSHGSACSSVKENLSPSLLAIGRSPDDIRNTLRLSVAPQTSEAELRQVIEVFVAFPKRQRQRQG